MYYVCHYLVVLLSKCNYSLSTINKRILSTSIPIDSAQGRERTDGPMWSDVPTLQVLMLPQNLGYTDKGLDVSTLPDLLSVVFLLVNMAHGHRGPMTIIMA